MAVQVDEAEMHRLNFEAKAGTNRHQEHCAQTTHPESPECGQVPVDGATTTLGL